MTGRHRSHWLAILLAVAISSGCTTTKTQSFAMSFLPSVPAPPAVPDLGEPPAIHPSMYSNEVPNLLEKLAISAVPSDGETRIKRAEQRFEAGKRFYQQGDTAAARTEFDQAVDILMAASPDLLDRQ